jgi:hypothetical protein
MSVSKFNGTVSLVGTANSSASINDSDVFDELLLPQTSKQ